MRKIMLTKETIDWKRNDMIFDTILCRTNNKLISLAHFFPMLEGVKEWTHDTKLQIFAHTLQEDDFNDTDDYLVNGIDNDGDGGVFTAEQLDAAPILTADVYYNQMGQQVRENLRKFVFSQATGFYKECLIGYDKLTYERKCIFLEQMQRHNLVSTCDFSDMFKFWELQDKGLITKEELYRADNRKLFLYLLDNCDKYKFSKEIALIWSHETYADFAHEAYFLILEAFEGNYAEFNKLLDFSAKRSLLRCVSLIKKEDILRVIYLFARFPRTLKTIETIFEEKKTSKSYSYKDILYEVAKRNLGSGPIKNRTETGELDAAIIKDSTREKLEKLFKKTYNRVPKVFDRIVSYCDARKIKPSDFMEHFNYKLLGKLLNTYHIYTALDFMTNHLNTNLIGLSELVIQELANFYINDETLYWLINHKKTQDDLLIKIIRYDIITDRNMTLRKVQSLLDIVEAKKEMKLIEQKYKNISFSFNNYISKIMDCTVEHEGVKAYMLKDERIAKLGELTFCCQRLNQAGESAMMYGLLASNGGFWAVEEKGRIFAQAEVWTGELDRNVVLVFDNIEIANDRPIDGVKPILKEWCKKSYYANIIMGIGYNELLIHDNKFVSVRGQLHQPKCKHIPYVYTDTRNGTVWLKKDGKIMF